MEPPLPAEPGDALKAALLAALAAGRFPPGARLPPERSLAATHGIGRAKVRRVLAELAAAGLIARGVGAGTFAAADLAARLPPAPVSPAALPSAEPGFSPAELMGARLIIEPALAAQACLHATAADLAALETACREGEQAADLAAFEHWDDGFHRAVAAATHNGFITRVFALISSARDAAEWGVLKQRSASPERRSAYAREHRAILAALRARDAPEAAAALAEHLRHVQRNMFGG